MPEYLVPALTQLGGSAPALLFWIAVIVFGAIMLGRGGGRAERFMIGGAAVGVLATLIKIPIALLPLWLTLNGPGMSRATGYIMGIVTGVVGAVGIVLLIYAFYLKFREWKDGSTATKELERGPHDALPG